VNLAAADIAFAIFLTPKYILSRTFNHPDGTTGKVLCRLLTGGTLGWFGGVSSAFTLVAVAVERFYAVMYPHGNKGRLTRRKLKVTYDALSFILDIGLILLLVNRRIKMAGKND